MNTLKFITIMSMLLITAIIKTYASEPEWIHYHTDNSDLTDNSMITIESIDGNMIWGTNYDGIIEFNNGNWNNYYYGSESIPYAEINDIIKYKGKLYFASDGGGLLYYDGNNWDRFTSFNSNLVSASVLSLEIVNDALWIGTNKGLVHFDGNDFITYNVDNSGLPGNFILTLKKDSIGNLWIGTDFGAVRYDGENWDVYDLSNSELPNRIVYNIAIDANNKVWFGTHYGLASYDGQEWQKYTTTNSEIPEDEVTALAAENDKIWLGSVRSGLIKFQNNEWTEYDSENSDFYGSGINNISIDKNGNKWLATFFDGVQVYREGGIILSAEEGGGPAQPGAIVFPNPAENSVVFEYSVDVPGGVLLEIYGSDGRKAAVPVDGQKAPGTHKAALDISALPAGVYHYRLKTRKGTASGSFVVTK